MSPGFADLSPNVSVSRVRWLHPMVGPCINQNLLFHDCPLHGSIDPGQDLVGHELHGTPGERGIGPVVPRIEEGAERADLAAQREYSVRDALRGSGNHETL